MKLPNPFKYWKILLLMAGLFLAGLVCGGVLTASAVGKAVVRGLSMEGWNRRTTRDLQHHLKLTPEQTEKVKAIADRYQPEVMALRNDTFKRFGALHRRFNAEVEAVLTPDQALVLSNLNARRTEKFQKTFNLSPATNAASPTPK
jgi:Spy/CpxP family protein refolding chaperone